jgi:hypothetical protein
VAILILSIVIDFLWKQRRAQATVA